MLVWTIIFEIPKSIQIHHFAALLDPNSFLRPNSTKVIQIQPITHLDPPWGTTWDPPINAMAALKRRFWPPLRVPASACLGAGCIMFYRWSADVSTDSYEKYGIWQNSESMRNGDISLSEQEIELFFKIGLGKIARGANFFFCSFFGVSCKSSQHPIDKWNMVAWPFGIPESSLN